MIEILQHIGVGLLGMIVYTLIAFRKYLKRKDIVTKAFWNAILLESLPNHVWTTAVLIVLSLTIHYLPESGEVLETLTGFNVAGNLMAFFTLGLTIASSLDSDKTK